MNRRQMLVGSGRLGMAGLALAVSACGDESDSPVTSGDLSRQLDPSGAPGPFVAVTPPDTTIAGAAGALNLPAEVRVARDARRMALDATRIDQWTAADWNTNFNVSLVSADEIESRGDVRDVIPPIDRPMFESIDAARAWLAPGESVVVVALGPGHRAYPSQILMWHEVVNDVAGGLPIAVTYSPDDDNVVVFDRRVYGAILRLGVSGQLRNDNGLLWDNLTESWWQQRTGEAIVGDFAGVLLASIAMQQMSMDAFADAYPGGQVLSRPAGSDFRYSER